MIWAIPIWVGWVVGSVITGGAGLYTFTYGRKAAPSSLGIEKNIGDFALEGGGHVSRSFEDGDDFNIGAKEWEYVQSVLAGLGCNKEAKEIGNDKVFAPSVHLESSSAYCRVFAYMAYKEYHELRYQSMRRYAQFFLDADIGEDGELSGVVDRWKEEDENVPDNNEIRHRPLVFKGGIMYVSAHSNKALCSIENLETIQEDEDLMLACALYKKEAHKKFAEILEDLTVELRFADQQLAEARAEEAEAKAKAKAEEPPQPQPQPKPQPKSQPAKCTVKNLGKIPGCRTPNDIQD